MAGGERMIIGSQLAHLVNQTVWGRASLCLSAREPDPPVNNRVNNSLLPLLRSPAVMSVGSETNSAKGHPSDSRTLHSQLVRQPSMASDR